MPLHRSVSFQVLAHVALYLLLALSALSALAAVPYAAEVVSLTGTGDYRTPLSAQWQPASVKLQLQPQSMVRTGFASTIGLLLADQAQIKLGQNSTFQLRAVASPANTGTRVWLQQGKAWSQTKNAGNGLSMDTPTMTAGIHGTDWLLEVEADGTSTITVLSGIVAVSNPFGAVDVGRNETATAKPGGAPVKRRLVSSSERVQWVSSYDFRPVDYPEWPRLLGDMTDWQARAPALQTKLAAIRASAPEPAAWALGAELCAWSGDIEGANTLLHAGRRLYPAEPRLRLLAAKLALGAGNPLEAHQALDGLAADFPTTLLRAALAHFEGRGELAEAQYRAAIRLAPERSEAWLGLGQVLAEREDLAAANLALSTANTLGAGTADAELGTLSVLADRPSEARRAYQRALDANPADYVALTGLGIAELKAGNDAAALDALLRANTIEPRYARSVLYMGIAYYRLAKLKAALETLDRAAELDPNDPFPYRIKALIARDRWLPDQALAADQMALKLQPKLRSLNQLAVDRAGSVELGGALADLGLANWASRLAQDAYYPYWGGSHLFLAKQYSSGFDHESELLLGLLTDPTVFGSHGPRQSILVQPGIGGQLSGALYQIAGSKLRNLQALLNGYQNVERPIAYLADLSEALLSASTSLPQARLRNATFGTGSKLTPALNTFMYVNQQRTDLSGLIAADGDTWRADGGLSWRLGPKAMQWLKLGAGRDHSAQQHPQNRAGEQTRSLARQDIQWRLSETDASGLTHSFGLELWRSQHDELDQVVARNTIDTTVADVDRGGQIWTSWEGEIGAWQLQADLGWQRYAKSKSEQKSVIFSSGRRDQQNLTVNQQSQGFYPRFGLRWRADENLALRAAWQDWLRPGSLATMMPVATVGMPLADNYVLPGGRLRQSRLQADWHGDKWLLSGFAEQLRVQNLNLLGPVDNNQQSLTSLDALQFADIRNFSSIEALEHPSVFGNGRVRNVGIELDYLLSAAWSAGAGFVHSDSDNLGGSGVPGAPLPYIPKQRARLMLTWTAAPWRIQGELLWRSERRTSELASSPLAAGWQTRLNMQWRGDDGRWLWNGYLRNQAHTDHPLSLGTDLVWKF